jgi:small subunit ribosomal protein S18e
MTGHDRAGELSQQQMEEMIAVVSFPVSFKVPEWFLNRQKDMKVGSTYLRGS